MGTGAGGGGERRRHKKAHAYQPLTRESSAATTVAPLVVLAVFFRPVREAAGDGIKRDEGPRAITRSLQGSSEAHTGVSLEGYLLYVSARTADRSRERSAVATRNKGAD